MALELYDLSDDPAESKNLAESHPEMVAEIAPLFESGRTPQENGDLLFSASRQKK